MFLLKNFLKFVFKKRSKNINYKVTKKDWDDFWYGPNL